MVLFIGEVWGVIEVKGYYLIVRELKFVINFVEGFEFSVRIILVRLYFIDWIR